MMFAGKHFVPFIKCGILENEWEIILGKVETIWSGIDS